MNGVHEVAVSGAGIGGLGVALSLAHGGVQSVVFERQHDWSEVGAGVQLGPNATRRLKAWGLEAALERCASWPKSVEVFDGVGAELLATLPLGEQCQTRYGAPYATLLRADLQTMLRKRVDQLGFTDVRLGEKLLHASVHGADRLTDGDLLHLPQDQGIEFDIQAQLFGGDSGAGGANETSELNAHRQSHSAQVLVGADGVFSRLRQTHFQKAPLQYTGHLAYRALIPWSDLPVSMRSSSVRLFLAPGLHWVQYPVNTGESLNVVVLLEVAPSQGVKGVEDLSQQRRFLSNPWNEKTSASFDQHQDLQSLLLALQRAHGQLRDVAGLVNTWTVWPLFAAPPLRSAEDMARGGLALLGDAAHPMLPYLAQGAGMSIEDAQVFSMCWGESRLSVSERLRRYAELRWQRCAKVQRQAMSNANVFHLGQPLRFMRNMAMRTLGARLLDMPWLYSH